MKFLRKNLLVIFSCVLLFQISSSNSYALDFSDFEALAQKKSAPVKVARKSGSSKIAKNMIQKKSKLSKETKQRLEKLNLAIKKTLENAIPGFSNNSLVSSSKPIDMKATLVKRKHHKELEKIKPGLVKPFKISQKNIPWSKIICSIRQLPEAKTNDPVINSSVDATIKMLSSPVFQKGFMRVVNKNSHRIKGKRSLVAAGSFLVGVFLWPTIQGAITGAAEAAGGSYGQGAGAYVGNTISGAIQGAAQGIQNTISGS